jgi:molybdopterin-guanine dinucleotide biosynthesis protein A
MKFNVIIPMGGESSRFNYNFKPLLKLDDRTFIEHVLEHFIYFDNIIESYNFIVTKEQNDKYGLIDKFHHVLCETITKKLTVHIIGEKTDGPFKTITEITNSNCFKNVFICDCDHRINISPMIEVLQKSTENIEFIIPTWCINEGEHNLWGKVLLKSGKIVNFFEKESVIIDGDEKIYGMVGCYYLNSTDIFKDNSDAKFLNISDFLKANHTKLNIKLCKIEDATFFGTPQMVRDAIETRRRYENIVCDVDGILIKHSPHSNAVPEDNILIKNCADKLRSWKKENKKIILMTARSKSTQNDFIKMLKEKGIVWDELIMGVNPGTRYVINDIKPTHIFTKQAVAINCVRDEGIDDICCNEHLNNDLKIIKKFKGGSFSTTYLIQKNDIFFVRKHIIKTPKTMEHYLRLKRQVEDLKRFYYCSREIVPKILHEDDNAFDYYYDMEYLENYKQLDAWTDRTLHKKAINQIMKKLTDNIYCFKKKMSEDEQMVFMNDFFQEKIECKLDKFAKDCDIMNHLINSNEVIINNKIYFGLRTVLKKIGIMNFKPTFICPIHGDLNFENILYNETLNDVKVIDMEGSRYVDSPLFDLGKLFQTLVARYESWSKMETVIFNKDIHNLACVDTFFDYDADTISFILDIFKDILEIPEGMETAKTITNLGIFYMATYFIRFVPFRLLVSKDHGVFALIMAVVWFNHIRDE